MEKALPCHELCQEKENEAFPHAPLEAVPVKKAGDSEGKIVNENEEQEKNGTKKVRPDFAFRDTFPPKLEFFLLLLPEVHYVHSPVLPEKCRKGRLLLSVSIFRYIRREPCGQ